MSTASKPVTPPSRFLMLLEPGRAMWELGAHYMTLPLLNMVREGDAHPVLIIPGLGASELSTRLLRRFLRGRGYWAHDWKLGRNIGDPEMMQPLVERLDQVRRRHRNRKISLIGWSLGGLYARELAKQAADDVRLVITLGSPFTGPPRASNADGAYEYLSGRRAGDPEMHARHRLPPPVPTTSIYSKSDGVVAWQCSVEEPGPLTENIEVSSSHLGLGVHPLVLYAIADRLSQPEGQWKPFAPPASLKWMYPQPQY